MVKGEILKFVVVAALDKHVVDHLAQKSRAHALHSARDYLVLNLLGDGLRLLLRQV